MGQQAIVESMTNHFKAIQLCVQDRLMMPALILIYTGIDVLATLSRPDGKDQTTRSDFIAWCDKYIVPQGEVACSGIDLYAARCGVVHAYTMESSLSKKGDAREIVYAWGNRKPEDLQSVIDAVGFTQRVIHIETLFEALVQGATQFFAELDDDPVRRSLVVSRGEKLFKNQPEEFWR